MSNTVIVIGGGAAGFFCAVNTARMDPSATVIILEKSQKLLSKVKVSGGGRCNVTHACFDISEMAGRYPRGKNFLKKCFHQFFTTDTVEWFKERGIDLNTEEDGRMFPSSNSSETIIRCLLDEAAKYNVQIRMQTEVSGLERIGSKWIVTVSDERKLEADNVCVSSGGFPKAGQFGWITATGHSISEPVPSLFTFNVPGNDITKLMGISVQDAQVKLVEDGLKERGPVLITHWGFSGPAILKLSSKAARELNERDYNFSILINWVPQYNEDSLRNFIIFLRQEQGGNIISTKNEFGLPQRLWQFLIENSGVGMRTRWSELPAKSQHLLVRNLCSYNAAVKGKTTFKEEFVTAGGVVLSEINASTMESKILPGLFFAGEVMDVDGITGGYNFQHAWTSGYVAAAAISGKKSK